ncbi:MAG: hypothetical protein K1W30_07865 [Lachnospiraceae bacterium]
MKNHIKKIIEILFGTKENIIFKFSLSALTTSIIFLILSILYKDNSTVWKLLVMFCGFFFATWMGTAKGITTVQHFVYELFRLCGFFACFFVVLNIFINISNYTGLLLFLLTIAACFIIFLCSFYLVVKFNDIFEFFQKTFKYLKNKLYNTTEPPTSKAKAFIENITALLASIVALSVAVQTIANTIINLFHSFR